MPREKEDRILGRFEKHGEYTRNFIKPGGESGRSTTTS